MNTENHTVTLPVKDYEELVNNQMPKNTKELTGGPIYTEVANAILRHHPDSNIKGMKVYFLLPNEY